MPAACVLVVAASFSALAATVSGWVLDPNWFSPHPKLTSPQLYGRGMYQYGVAGNIAGSSQLGFSYNTEDHPADNPDWGRYGYFKKENQPDGLYTLATYDSKWRSAFAFNRSLVGESAPEVNLRLHANMWSYAPLWEGNYREFGQTFAATGSSVVMVVVRSAVSGVVTTASIHDGGPSGAQIGPSRTATLSGGPSDYRYVWNGGEVPTVPGRTYYLKLMGNNWNGVLCNNEPIPDMSDAMPEGLAYHEGVPWSQTAATVDFGKAMDLGITICSDDDGILTNLFTRSSGSNIMYAQSIGQTFRARGTSLLSFCAWIPDINSTYVATLYTGVGGVQLGTAKKSRVMRAADPEIMWTWVPGEIPLTPGQTYYIEVTMDGGGIIVSAYANQNNMYLNGEAYKNRSAIGGWDLAGTIMEEESPGSATVPTVQLTSFPTVAFADRGTNSLTVRWTTDVPADSTIEYAAWNAPYTDIYTNSSPVTDHVATITGLSSNTMYHLRVKSAAAGYRTGVTRDFVACTINDTVNLLSNPSFEAPAGTPSPVKPVPRWTCVNLDFGESNGTWFYSIPPYAGTWFLQGVTNSASCDAQVYQTVSGVTPGQEYNFTVAVSSWMRENDTWKYESWDGGGDIDNIKIGIDPYGNNNPNNPAVHWTPGMYSHCHYTTIGMREVAQNSSITVCISLKGQGGQWHIYGIDDCRLSVKGVAFTPYDLVSLKSSAPDGVNAEVANLIITATAAEVGSYYAEMPDRTSGIRIVCADPYVFVGKRATIRGTLATDSQTHERYLNNASVLNQVTDVQPQPLAMGCNDVGGAALGTIPAVQGSFGPHNTGLVVKVAGVVKMKDANSKYVFINDGSMPGIGIKVDTSRISSSLVPNVGEIAVFSGISTLYYNSTLFRVMPAVLVRRASDVVFRGS